MRKTFLTVAAAILMAWAGTASADTTTVDVTAKVVGSCRFLTGGTMAFGDLDPGVGSNVNATVTQPTFWCTKNASFTITDDDGGNGTHNLIGATYGELIPYSFSYTANGNGAGPTTTLTMDISGQILGADYAGASEDDYSDTVTLTIVP